MRILALAALVGLPAQGAQLLSGLPDPLVSQSACMAFADQVDAGKSLLPSVALAEAMEAHNLLGDATARLAYDALYQNPENHAINAVLVRAVCRSIDT